MNLRIHYVLPFCLLFACDKTERDWSKCSGNDAAPCAQGYTCTPDFRCVRPDGGPAEVPAAPADAGGREVAGIDAAPATVDATADVPLDVAVDAAAVDAPVDAAPVDGVADAATGVAVEAPVDAPRVDAATGITVDTRPVDLPGSCGSDNDCVASGTMCLAFRCAKCTGNSDCTGRGDGGVGGNVCDPTSGRCVACVQSSDCTADPTKPVCAANQCVTCTTNSQCSGRADGGVSAGVCDTTTGRCVACVQSSDCTADPTKPVCLSNRCGACTANSQCSGRSSGSVSVGVCDTTSGRCVACVQSSDCTADPTKPVCAANQCVACKSAESECRIKNSGAPVCDQTSGKCVGCLTNDNCGGGSGGGVDAGADGGVDGGVAAGFCYLATNQCVECLVHTDCKDPTRPICGSLHTCVGCGAPGVAADSCATRNPALRACKADTGACVECTGNTNCVGDAGIRVCNPATNKCVECNDNSNCTANSAAAFCVNNACTGCQTAGTGACTGAKPICATSGGYAGQCVECIGNADCKVATKPVCDTNQCRACAKDGDCTNISPAVVCGLDGSCPGDNAVIYLQNSVDCSTASPGNGTSATPYCSSDDATAALSATKSVIVIKGPLAVGNLTLSFAQKPVLIAGQSSANLTKPTTGTPPLVNITAGEVTLRDLTIPGGSDAGVSVSGGAILHMDRCYVLNNQGIGIQTTASAFDIVNTVIAGNGTAAGGYGVSLGTYSGSPTRFAFNTVVNNVGGGVFCGTPSDYKLTGILANANGPTNFLNCQTDSTTSTAAPNFGTNYHLTATSPCVNAGGPTCPPDDIDGDTRPQGTACDCGADEYKTP